MRAFSSRRQCTVLSQSTVVGTVCTTILQNKLGNSSSCYRIIYTCKYVPHLQRRRKIKKEQEEIQNYWIHGTIERKNNMLFRSRMIWAHPPELHASEYRWECTCYTERRKTVREGREEPLSLSQPERRHGSTRVAGNACLPCVTSHGGWLCTFTIKQQLEIFYQLAAGQLLSGQLVRYGIGRRYGPSITYKITPSESLSSSQPGGPPCWPRPLAFGLIGLSRQGGRRGIQMSQQKNSQPLPL